MANLDANDAMASAQRRGHWNDADALQVRVSRDALRVCFFDGVSRVTMASTRLQVGRGTSLSLCRGSFV